jgi:hypothetical protein
MFNNIILSRYCLYCVGFFSLAPNSMINRTNENISTGFPSGNSNSCIKCLKKSVISCLIHYCINSRMNILNSFWCIGKILDLPAFWWVGFVLSRPKKVYRKLIFIHSVPQIYP